MKSIVLMLVLFVFCCAVIVANILPSVYTEASAEPSGLAELEGSVAMQATELPPPAETEPTEIKPTVVEIEPTATYPPAVETEPVSNDPTFVPSYSKVKETVYASAAVNIRSGPGKKYTKVGRLAFAESIIRIGIGDNGWSKVLYQDMECFIFSDYLVLKKPHVETVSEEMARRGNIGRLKIPSVGVDVALFNTSVFDLSLSQPIVDRSDSAAYMPDSIDCYGFVLIGDHRHQGFDAIKQSVINSTVAYIDRGTYTESYICTNVLIGYNGYKGKTGLFDSNGTPLYETNNSGLCMYTCNTDETITITFWQPVS